MSIAPAVLLAADSPVAEAFCRARLGSMSTGLYGGLPDGLDTAAVVERAFPPA